jgi:hypothetical protein
MKPDREGTGAERIAFERRRQTKSKGYSEKHDDGHMDHSLALAACAYAAPAQVFRMRDHGDSVSFVDCWPITWHRKYDKRPRHDSTHRILEAAAMTPMRRIRQLEKAGALIAAEIDRLLRLERKGAK